MSLNYAFSSFKPQPNKAEELIAAIIQSKEISKLAEIIEKAAEKGQGNLLEFTDTHGCTPLILASYANLKDLDKRKVKDAERLPVVQFLIEKDPSTLNLKDKDGWTALFWAAWSGMPLVCGELIKDGNNINDVDRLGNTPLMLATRRGNDNIVQLLLDKGADPTIKNHEGLDASAIAQEKIADGKLPDSLAIPYLAIIDLLDDATSKANTPKETP